MAKSKASSTIGKNVSNLLAQSKTEARSNPSLTQLRTLSKSDPLSYNSRVLTSVATFHRLTKGGTTKSDTIPSEIINDYRAAATIIAEKRGIKPKGKDGNFSEEQYSKEFSPVEVMKDLAGSTVKELAKDAQTPKDKDERIQDANTLIENSIASAYEEEPIPADVSRLYANTTYMTDEEFLEKPEEEQNAYLSQLSEYEQNALKEKLKEHKGNFDTSKNAGRMRGNTGDPDWGYKKDDDFKIEQGDIIDYLMKEVILASAAWAANKASGFAGIVAYEISSAAYRKVHPWMRKGWLKALSSYEYLKNRLSGGNASDDDKTRASLIEKYGEKVHSEAEHQTANLRENQTNLANGLNRYFLEKQIDMTMGKCIPSENGCEYENVTYNYTEICRDTGKTPESIFNTLKTLENDANTVLEAEFLKELGLTQDSPSTDIEKAKQWLNSQREAEKQTIKKETPTHPKEIEINGKPASAAYSNAQKNTVASLHAGENIREIIRQKECFSATYAHFCLTELIRTNPNHEIFRDDNDSADEKTPLTAEDKVREYIKSRRVEGDIIFYSNLKNLKDGNTAALSSEDMIERISAAAETSTQKCLKEEYSGEVENPFRETAEKTNNQTFQTAAKDFINSTTVEDMLLVRKQDLVKEQEFLETQQTNTDEKRSHIAELKKTIGYRKDTNEQAITNTRESSIKNNAVINYKNLKTGQSK